MYLLIDAVDLFVKSMHQSYLEDSQAIFLRVICVGHRSCKITF